MSGEDWVNRLFQGGEQTRGLSGAGATSLALSDANAFYNFRLRRHVTSADVAAEPMRIWSTSDDAGTRAGLGVHIAEVLADDRPFTDVLIVLSSNDYERAFREDPSFDDTLVRLFGDAYDDLLRRHHLPKPERRLGVWVAREGSEEIGGTNLGLLEGEFVTGILPNLYRRPGATSRATVALHLNLPGVWDGYREVGRLYNDQLLFTFGSYWLDNFSDPSLREPALFSLRRAEGGEVVHILNPDVADRYQVHLTDQGGISVITLATIDGHPLAYVVLWSVEDPVDDVMDLGEAELEPLVEELRTRTLDDVDLEPLPRKAARTILPEAHKERIFTLQERGALFQRVHFAAFMLGYDVYLGVRGEVGTVVDEVAATFQIRKKTISVHANVAGVSLNGTPLPQGEARTIEADTLIEVGNQRLEFRDLRGIELDGWPYVGEVRRPAASTYMLWGRSYSLGRSRECRVVLPDEPRNDNIVWKPKIGDGSNIHTKNGEIPKSRFYTDSIMVASEHGSIELQGDAPELVCLAKNCNAFIRRGADVLTLHQTSSGKQPQRLPLEPGDEVLIGNCLFHVSFTATGSRAVEPAPAPVARMTTDVLADAVSMPDLDELDAPPPSSFHTMPVRSPLAVDLPDTVDEAPPPPRVERPRVRWGETTPDITRETARLDLEPLDAPEPVAHQTDPFGTRAPLVGLTSERTDPGRGGRTGSSGSPLVGASPSVVPEPLAARPVDLRSEGLSPELARTVEMSPRPRPVEPPPRERALEPAPKEAEPPRAAPPRTMEVPRTVESPRAPEPRPARPPEADAGRVVVVSEADARIEMARPARFVLDGWMVQGSASCGNHSGADLIIPESRVRAGQRFAEHIYFDVRVRGRKGSLEVRDRSEVHVQGGATHHEPIDGLRLAIVRRDDAGEEDFTVDLVVADDPALPDPRARLLRVERDALAAGLFARGVPLRVQRTVTLGPITLTARFDGQSLLLADYLSSYQKDEDWTPFFVQSGEARFVTAPEDGSEITLAPGDRVIVGALVYRFETSG